MIKTDSIFAAKARSHQNTWRVEKGYPIGSYKSRDGKIIELGNYIETGFAYRTGANFITESTFKVVQTALENKEKGAKIEETRLYTNLLSSQPLAFNLFGELSLNLDLATAFLQTQFPGMIKRVTRIIFEHSDGRGNKEYTGDHSAFDVFIEFITPDEKSAFIGIEVKYAENLKDAPSSHKERYTDLTFETGIFRPESISHLTKKPIQQIWRDHLLALSHLNHPQQKYQDGYFLYLYPIENQECLAAVAKYTEQFISFNPDSKTYDTRSTKFLTKNLKAFVQDLRTFQPTSWTESLFKRYFWESEFKN